MAGGKVIHAGIDLAGHLLELIRVAGVIRRECDDRRRIRERKEGAAVNIAVAGVDSIAVVNLDVVGLARCQRNRQQRNSPVGQKTSFRGR